MAQSPGRLPKAQYIFGMTKIGVMTSVIFGILSGTFDDLPNLQKSSVHRQKSSDHDLCKFADQFEDRSQSLEIFGASLPTNSEN